MNPITKLTTKYEEERVHAQEQTQIVYLQGQIDDLRQQLKEQTSRYHWAMEQTRKTEATVSQIQGVLERYAEDAVLLVERSKRDILGLRKEVATALVKIDESIKPIREIQVQIQQLAESRKQDRDYVFPWFARIEDGDQKMLSLQAQIKEYDEGIRQLARQIDQMHEADGVVLQEARRVSDDLQVEKHSLRRQIIETQQLIAGLNTLLEEQNSKISQVDEIHERIELFAEALPAQITEVANQFPGLITEIKRVERITNERFMLNHERIEDLRHQVDERTSVLHETDERYLRQLTSWLERIDSWVRDLEQRLSRSIVRLEAIQQTHVVRIVDLEQRELQVITGLAASFREQAEAVKLGLTQIHDSAEENA